jgi:hypothetical protein
MDRGRRRLAATAHSIATIRSIPASVSVGTGVAEPDGLPPPPGTTTASDVAPHPESMRWLALDDEPAISLPTQEVTTWLADVERPPAVSSVPAWIWNEALVAVSASAAGAKASEAAASAGDASVARRRTGSGRMARLGGKWIEDSNAESAAG